MGSSSERGRLVSVLRAAAPIVGLHAVLLAAGDPAARPAVTLATLGAACAALAWGVGALRAVPGARGPVILAVACLLRLLLLPLPPSLSDDLERYVWDGRVAAAGWNPYELAPGAAELAPLRARWGAEVPHAEVATVYPPLAVALFSIAARLPRPALALKIVFAACDLAACALLLVLARRRGLPEERCALYAWNPLVTLEVAGMGHVEGLGVAAMVAAVVLLAGPRPRASAAGAAAAAGVLAKLVPVVALPSWARWSGAPARFLLAALGLAALALAPVAWASGGIPAGLARYAVAWEFNGPLWEPLWRGLDAAGAAPAVKAALDRLEDWTGWHEAWNLLYPYVYPQLLAKLVLAAGFAVFWLAVWRRGEPVSGTGRLLGAALLCSAVVYPWYLLWVLPWAALCRHPTWLAASALAPLSYLPQLAGAPLYPWIHLAVWGPCLALLPFSRWSLD